MGRQGRVGGPPPQGPVPVPAGLMDGNGCSIGTHILSYKPTFCPISPKDDDSNTDDTKTGIDGSMDDSDSK